MFTCTVDGKTVRIADLDSGVFANIEKETGVRWIDVFQGPIQNLEAGSLLLQRCAEHLGVEPPNPITVQVLVDAFELETRDTDGQEGEQREDPSDDGGGS